MQQVVGVKPADLQQLEGVGVMTSVQTVPSVIFKTRVRDERVAGENPFRWQDVDSQSLFSGRRVVVFALPGAFTPTCSSTHAPGFEALHGEILQQGVDEVICLSVNDAFTMYQWGGI